jgi:UPF0755 protein
MFYTYLHKITGRFKSIFKKPSKNFFAKTTFSPKRFFLVSFLILIFLIIIFVRAFLYNAPNNFPSRTLFTITKGESLSEIADLLYKKNIIRSPFLFKNFIIYKGGERGAIAGDYYINQPESVFSLATRVTSGNFGIVLTKITIPEGWDVPDIVTLLSKNFDGFDSNTFAKIAPEGYLFPDTYFLKPNVTPQDVIKLMQDNFNKKIETLRADIRKFNQPLNKIIIVASIVEKEARTEETRRIIAGILWRRLSLGMPLQVDSSFSYVNGKSTFDLTLDDLKIDSPYNTYRYKGLPPTPISNPGIDSILAAIHPIKTDYLYFLSDKSGTMHYAKTFEDHKKNRDLYLNN